MQQATVRITAPASLGRGMLQSALLWLVLLEALFCFALRGMLDWDMSWNGMSFGEALWHATNRRLTVTVAVLGVLLLVVSVALIIGTPRRHTHREARVDRDGLELLTRPKWWYRGGRTLIRWDDVQVISAEHAIFREWKGRTTTRVARESLNFYLFRGIESVPDFAATETVSDSPLEELDTPAFRVHVAGRGKQMAASIRDLARAINAVRPDLFYRGTAVDQWFAATPPETSPGIGAEAKHVAPSPPRREALQPRTPASFALSAPLWLDFRAPPWRTFTTLAVLVTLAVVCYLPIHFLAETDGGILIGLIGLVFAVPFLFGVITASIHLFSLPRFLARTGIRVMADGLEVVAKRSWSLNPLRLSVSRIPWSDVQAVVARQTAALDEHGINHARYRPVTDFYLRGDTAFHNPGVGLSLKATRLARPDSAKLGELVGFPAVRLRLPHSPKAARQTAERWGEVPGGPGQDQLPGTQLRAALYAARPDLCHGFDDADMDIGVSVREAQNRATPNRI